MSRGKGIDQRSLLNFYRRMLAGGWCHIFPGMKRGNGHNGDVTGGYLFLSLADGRQTETTPFELPIASSCHQRTQVADNDAYCYCHDNSNNQVRTHRTGFCHSGVKKYSEEKIIQTPKVVRTHVIAEASRTYVSGSYWCIRSRLAAKTDYTARHQGKQHNLL